MCPDNYKWCILRIERLETRRALDAAPSSVVVPLASLAAGELMKACEPVVLLQTNLWSPSMAPENSVGSGPYDPGNRLNIPSPLTLPLVPQNPGASEAGAAASPVAGVNNPPPTFWSKEPQKLSSKKLDSSAVNFEGNATTVFLVGQALPAPMALERPIPLQHGPLNTAVSIHGSSGEYYLRQAQSAWLARRGRSPYSTENDSSKNILWRLGPRRAREVDWPGAAYLPPQGCSSIEAAAVPAEAPSSGNTSVPERRTGSLRPDVLDQCFVQLWETARRAQPSGGDRGQPAIEGEGPGLLPLYVGVAVPAAGKPLDPVAAGYQYLCNYCRHAIHAAERRVGPLPDHDDIIQQTCLEWLQQAGPPEAAFPRLLERASSEMQLLRETVNRVIMRITYQHRKGGVNADLSDWPAPDGAVERAWTDFKSDCEEGVGHLTQQDWQILELRRQGHTYREIGAKIGIARQRVWEMCHDLVARLQDIYGKVGDWEKRT